MIFVFGILNSKNADKSSTFLFGIRRQSMICDHIIWAQLARLSPCCLFKIGEIYIPRLDILVSKILFGYLFIVQLHLLCCGLMLFEKLWWKSVFMARRHRSREGKDVSFYDGPDQPATWLPHYCALKCLHKALYDDYFCLVAAKKQQI